MASEHGKMGLSVNFSLEHLAQHKDRLESIVTVAVEPEGETKVGAVTGFVAHGGKAGGRDTGRSGCD